MYRNSELRTRAQEAQIWLSRSLVGHVDDIPTRQNRDHPLERYRFSASSICLQLGEKNSRRRFEAQSGALREAGRLCSEVAYSANKSTVRDP